MNQVTFLPTLINFANFPRTKMQFTFYVADAFVDPAKPFSGNPAAVVILSNESDISDEAKQNVAAEFNLSETVFVSKLKGKDKDQFLIRWFTPINEVELCGHATMAASYVLYSEKHQYTELIDQSKPLKYRTNFGLHLEASYDGQYVTLNFPSNDPVSIDKTHCKWITKLQRAIIGSDNDAAILDAQLAPNNYLLVRLSDHIDIEQVKPNFDQMVAIDTGRAVNLAMITQRANFEQTGAHFTARAFAPWLGAREDPVCGSAFTLMAPYWDRVYRQENRGPENGLFYAKQMSKRGGLVTSKLVNNRVFIGGQVKLFSKGQFKL